VGTILLFCSAAGSSSVYVDVSGHASMTLYQLIYLGHSFQALFLGMFRFFVDRYTRLPMAMAGSCHLHLLALSVWNVLTSIITSCTSAKLLSADSTNSFIPLTMPSLFHTFFNIDGIYPSFNSNGAYPVVFDMLTFMANSVIGILLHQSF
jgi:hypothetical protein